MERDLVGKLVSAFSKTSQCAPDYAIDMVLLASFAIPFSLLAVRRSDEMPLRHRGASTSLDKG